MKKILFALFLTMMVVSLVPESAQAQTNSQITVSGYVRVGILPISGAAVILVSPNGYTTVTATSDANGHFSLNPVPSGMYTLMVYAANFMPWSAPGMILSPLIYSIGVNVNMIPVPL